MVLPLSLSLFLTLVVIARVTAYEQYCNNNTVCVCVSRHQWHNSSCVCVCARVCVSRSEWNDWEPEMKVARRCVVCSDNDNNGRTGGLAG